MKKFLTILMAALFAACLFLTALAEDEGMRRIPVAGCGLTIPEDWDLFTEDLGEDPMFDMQGRLVSPDYGGLVIEIGPIPADGFAPIDQWTADDPETCAALMLAGLEEYAPEFVDTVQAGEAFLPVVRASEEAGPCCLACGLAGEGLVGLRAYAVDPTSGLRMTLTEENMEQLTRILGSFGPEA